MLLRCPSCGACAVSEAATPDTKKPALAGAGTRRLVCPSCGHARQWSADRAKPRRRAIGVDPYFHLPYWLVARCRHGVVYAVNEEQLAYLESFIAAGLRERRRGAHGWANSSYISRLPDWTKSAKNRADLLRCIGRLKAKVAAR